MPSLCSIKLDKNTYQLVVFTDFSFTNNKDILYWIRYVVYLVDITNKANIIY